MVAVNYSLTPLLGQKMKRNFSVELLDLNGDPVTEKDAAGKDKNVLISALVANALLGQYPDEQTLSGEDKIKRFCLAERVNEGGLREYTAEEISLIKTLSVKAFSTLATARIWQVCENETAQETPPSKKSK